MSGVKIRDYKETDLPAIKTIFEEFVQFHAERDPAFQKVSNHPELFGLWIKENSSSEQAIVCVAEVDGEVVGYCLGIIQSKPPVYINPNYGFIDNLAVLEKYQRKGIGQQLYSYVKRWFESQDIERIELYAAISNEKSTSFWGKMGFASFMECLYRKI